MVLSLQEPGFMSTGIKWWKMRNSLLITTSSDPLAKFWVSIPSTLCSTSLEVLSRGMNAFTRRHNTNSIELELRLPPHHLLYIPQASESTGKEESYGIGWVIDPD